MKRIFTVFLFAMIMLSLSANASASEMFTTADALMVLRAATGSVQLTAEQIARFDMDGDGIITTADALEILRRATGLITIRGTQYSTGLTALDLTGTGLTDEDMQLLKFMTNLEVLYLNDNRIRTLLPLAELVNLRTLGIWENFIADITPLAELVNLETLYLDASSVSDFDFSVLIGLENLKTLYILDLYILCDDDSEQFELLRESLPVGGLEIRFSNEFFRP